MKLKSLDYAHLGQYMLIMDKFLQGNLSAIDFKKCFILTRRDDKYLFSGLYDVWVENLLSKLFLAVDDYAPLCLREPEDIDEEELIDIVRDIYNKFLEAI